MNQPHLDLLSLQPKIAGKGEAKRTQGGGTSQQAVRQLKMKQDGVMSRQAELERGKSNTSPH
jgi:hypothetical protein